MPAKDVFASPPQHQVRHSFPLRAPGHLAHNHDHQQHHHHHHGHHSKHHHHHHRHQHRHQRQTRRHASAAPVLAGAGAAASAGGSQHAGAAPRVHHRDRSRGQRASLRLAHHAAAQAALTRLYYTPIINGALVPRRGLIIKLLSDCQTHATLLPSHVNTERPKDLSSMLLFDAQVRRSGPIKLMICVTVSVVLYNTKLLPRATPQPTLPSIAPIRTRRVMTCCVHCKASRERCPACTGATIRMCTRRQGQRNSRHTTINNNHQTPLLATRQVTPVATARSSNTWSTTPCVAGATL